MARGTCWARIAPLVFITLLTGCRFEMETREPWRGEAELQCIAEKGVVPSVFIEPASAINGPGVCGMDKPFKVTALEDGNVILEPRGTLACPVIRELNGWLADVIQPAALAWFGQPVTAIRQMSAYSCRGMNGDPNAKISEHAFGNALDIGAFKIGDRWITVKNGWKGSPEERGFLLQVQAGACERFTTVLAPGSNVFHYDHIHVDLMRHAKGRTICKPAPRPMPAPMTPMGAAPQTVSYPARAPDVQQDAPGMIPLPATAPPAALEPARRPQAEMPPPAQVPAAAPHQERVPPPPPSGNGLPPGWIVGPEGHVSGPMSYAPSGASGGLVTGSVPTRKYYSTTVPQPSPLPLPKAKAGED